MEKLSSLLRAYARDPDFWVFVVAFALSPLVLLQY